MPLSKEALQRELNQCTSLLYLLADKLTALSEAIVHEPKDAGADAEKKLFPQQPDSGNKEEDLFLPPNERGNKDDYLFQRLKEEGNKLNEIFHQPNEQGNKEKSIFPSHSEQGNKHDYLFLAPNEGGNKQTPLASHTLPAIAQLYEVLHNGEMHGVRHETIMNVAATLLRFARAPDGQSQRKLAIWLKLSKSGIAKYMMMLFRRRLIVRIAYQTYALTDKAAAIVEAARHVNLSGNTGTNV